MDNGVLQGFTFQGSTTVFSRVAIPLDISTIKALGVWFLHILPNVCYFLFVGFFFNSHVNRCEGISHNRLDLHLLGTTDFEHLFMCLLPICISLWRNISSNSLTIVFFFLILLSFRSYNQLHEFFSLTW